MKNREQSELVDPLDELLGYQLRRAALATMTRLDAAFAPAGVSLTEAIILRFVGANPGCNQAAISRALGVTRTNMVPFISNLADRHFVERKVSDGRTNALFLTASGKTLSKRLAAITAQQDEYFFGGFDRPTREVLFSVLARLRALAESS